MLIAQSPPMFNVLSNLATAPISEHLLRRQLHKGPYVPGTLQSFVMPLEWQKKLDIVHSCLDTTSFLGPLWQLCLRHGHLLYRHGYNGTLLEATVNPYEKEAHSSHKYAYIIEPVYRTAALVATKGRKHLLCYQECANLLFLAYRTVSLQNVPSVKGLFPS